MEEVAALCLAAVVLVTGVALAIPVVDSGGPLDHQEDGVDDGSDDGPPRGPPDGEDRGNVVDVGLFNLTDVPTPSELPDPPTLSSPTPTPEPTTERAPTPTDDPLPTPSPNPIPDTETPTPTATATSGPTPTATSPRRGTSTSAPADTSTPGATPTSADPPVHAGGSAPAGPTPTPSATPTSAAGSVDVVAASTAADWVRAGYETTVWATVENDGATAETVELTVTLGGRPVATRTVTVAGGETTTVDLSLSPSATGGGTVAVEGVDAGTLNVVGEGASRQQIATPYGEQQPGFGGAPAVVALLGAALLAWRRTGGDEEPGPRT